MELLDSIVESIVEAVEEKASGEKKNWYSKGNFVF